MKNFLLVKSYIIPYLEKQETPTLTLVFSIFCCNHYLPESLFYVFVRNNCWIQRIEALIVWQKLRDRLGGWQSWLDPPDRTIVGSKGSNHGWILRIEQLLDPKDRIMIQYVSKDNVIVNNNTYKSVTKINKSKTFFVYVNIFQSVIDNSNYEL